jgi:hypothetical protein
MVPICRIGRMRPFCILIALKTPRFIEKSANPRISIPPDQSANPRTDQFGGGFSISTGPLSCTYRLSWPAGLRPREGIIHTQ